MKLNNVTCGVPDRDVVEVSLDVLECFCRHLSRARRPRSSALLFRLHMSRRSKRVAAADASEDSASSASAALPASASQPSQGSQRDPDPNDVAEYSIFDAIVASNGDETAALAQDWAQLYEEDDVGALTQLVNLLIQSSGNPSFITRSDFITDVDPTELLEALMTDAFKMEGGVYPIISKDKLLRHFRDHLMDFVDKLVTACAKSILYDDNMLVTFVAWLSILGSSVVQPFRHTATAVSYQLVSSLLHLSNELERKKENAERQLKALQRASKSPSRVKKVSHEVKSFATALKVLKSTTEAIVDESIFKHRYRDVHANIRAESISSLGEWILERPSWFLGDTHLKYLGWALFDRVANVRLESLCAVTSLYEDRNNIENLELFTKKFSDRIVEMVMDKSTDVASQAIALCGHLADCECLTTEHLNSVVPLLSDVDHHVRAAAGEFVAQHVLHVEPSSTSSRGKRAKVANVGLIKHLLKLVLSGPHADYPSYPVDALMAHMPVLHDWDTLATALLMEDDDMESEQQVALAQICLLCIQLASGEAVVATPAFKKPSRAQVQSAQKSFTETMIPKLPDLMNRYGADADVLSTLIVWPQYFKPSFYDAKRKEKAHSALLQCLEDAFSQHHSPHITEGVVNTLQFLTDSRYTLSGRAKDALQRIVTKLLGTVSGLLEEAESSPSVYSDADSMLLVEMQRLHLIYRVHDIVPDDTVVAGLEAILELAAGGDDDDDVVLVDPCLTHLVIHMLWLRVAYAHVSRGGDRETVSILHDNFVLAVKPLLTKDDDVVAQNTALLCLCQELVLSSHGTSAAVRAELCPPELRRDMQKAFLSLMQHAAPNSGASEQDDDDDDDDDDDVSRFSDLTRIDKAAIIEAFASLVLVRVLPPKAASFVLAQFVAHGAEETNVVNAFLQRFRVMSLASEAHVLRRTFIHVWTSIAEQDDALMLMYDSPERTAVRQLSHRLLRSLGVRLSPERKETVVTFLENMVPWALEYQPTGYALMADVVGPFVRRAPNPGKCLEAVEARMASMGLKPQPGDDFFDDYEEFMNHVLAVVDPSAAKPTRRGANRTPRKKKKARAKRGHEEEEEEEESGDADSSVSTVSAGEALELPRSHRSQRGSRRSSQGLALEADGDDDEGEDADDDETTLPVTPLVAPARRRRVREVARSNKPSRRRPRRPAHDDDEDNDDEVATQPSTPKRRSRRRRGRGT